MNPTFCFIVQMFDFVKINRITKKSFRNNDFLISPKFMSPSVYTQSSTGKLSDISSDHLDSDYYFVGNVSWKIYPGKQIKDTEYRKRLPKKHVNSLNAIF